VLTSALEVKIQRKSVVEVPMKLVRRIEMRFNETHSKGHIGKYLSDNCPIQIGLKQKDALTQLLFNFVFECHYRSWLLSVT
jgi:hypothetical protein